jgi:hypothetical protein
LAGNDPLRGVHHVFGHDVASYILFEEQVDDQFEAAAAAHSLDLPHRI